MAARFYSLYDSDNFVVSSGTWFLLVAVSPTETYLA